MGALSPSSNLIHSLFFLHPKPSFFFSCFSKTLLISSTSISLPQKCFFPPYPHSAIPFSHQPPSLASPSLVRFASLSSPNPSPAVYFEEEAEAEAEAEEEEEEEEEEYEDEVDIEDRGNGDEEVVGSELRGTVEISSNLNGGDVELPVLTSKEKKELASYAHSLGDKLKSQLVGKSGVTANVATSFVETLEANELLKIKIHRTCPGEIQDVVKQLEEATGSIVVGQIGRTVIIYRPSLSKLKAEEKRRLARKMFVRKDSRMRPTLLDKIQAPRHSNRGRRGISRET